MTLVDTGPLVALCDSRDRWHVTARQQLGRLARTGLCTCDSVIAEACFHLPHRAQRERLRSVLDEFRISPPATGTGPALWLEIVDWMLKYAEHEPDWADAYLAVWSGHDTALKVWTYDREFRTTWRRPDGSAVPLA
jgi:predicted nucleic acid-binding protein